MAMTFVILKLYRCHFISLGLQGIIMMQGTEYLREVSYVICYSRKSG